MARSSWAASSVLRSHALRHPVVVDAVVEDPEVDGMVDLVAATIAMEVVVAVVVPEVVVVGDPVEVAEAVVVTLPPDTAAVLQCPGEVADITTTAALRVLVDTRVVEITAAIKNIDRDPLSPRNILSVSHDSPATTNIMI